MNIERVYQLPLLLERPRDGHKGTFGRVLVVGGDDQTLGAPVLAGTSALRMGAGLVQIAIPRAILAAALSVTPELIGLALGKTASNSELRVACDKADAIVVGPGLGQLDAARKRLKYVTSQNRPIVIDADALNLISSEKCWPKWCTAPAVLTPHPGEMKRLAKLIGESDVPTDDRGRIDLAHRASIAFKQVIVLKGHRTIVADGKRIYVNLTGDSTLSKAGTGDVLSGMIGALLAQRMDRFDAACAAVWIHGRMGELAGKKIGQRSALAREIIDQLPQAIRDYESAR